MKPCHTTVTLSTTSKPNLTFLWTNMPGSANALCQKLIMISIITSKNNSTLHLLTMRAVLHFKWVSFCLPLKGWRVKEQLALTTLFLHLFLNHSVLWPSRNYYPYSIHSSLLLTAQECRGLPSSFHYWKLGNHLVKLHISISSVWILYCQTSGKNSCWLSYIAEKKNLFSQFQPGIHKRLWCKDQIAWIFQAIEDGFQQRSMQRSALTLLDFSKAYNTVWREKPLDMLDADILSTFTWWLHSFLNDCRAHVQLFKIISSSRHFTHGLPQGPVLAPLLFLFYINNLVLIIKLLANAIMIFTTTHKGEDVEAAPQSVVKSVFDWSQQWKLNLNADEKELCSFSTSSNNSTWQPALFIGYNQISINHNPCLLGIILDRSLTFNVYMKKLVASLKLNLCVYFKLQHLHPGANDVPF